MSDRAVRSGEADLAPHARRRKPVTHPPVSNLPLSSQVGLASLEDDDDAARNRDLRTHEDVADERTR
ncbi:hypothetical protein [Streptomyces sp. Inha503]|uniref:hypothetical protein n=1 Tax=Streptomyces sp. Inha503 TaxID=3383314 RepID=UPI0039A04352